MPTFYSNNMLGFLLSLPGAEEETWVPEQPLDDTHREAKRLGLIESCGRPVRTNEEGLRERPYRLTQEGVEMRRIAARTARRG